ncbi:RNA-binding protein 12B-like isoform X3 [Xyrauchen texanus]|uniref:RNA-binding protein 12B-like isoform X3 n=1 Tax=Xyrauchen texanus TaxID=154827 RepID=UPI002242798E|nr:RNA-binding protein 12B-like isoform X3 [Xyrauchen texanus]
MDLQSALLREITSCLAMMCDMQRNLLRIVQDLLSTPTPHGHHMDGSFLPLRDAEALLSLAHDIKTKPEKRKDLVLTLGLAGGVNLKDTVWRVMKMLIQNDLACKMNWTGLHGKTSFQGLEVKNVVTAIRRNPGCRESTNQEVEQWLRRWLYLAGDREGGRRRRSTVPHHQPPTISHPPTHNVSHPPTHNVSHPPTHNVRHTPAHNVRHTPAHNVRHTPAHNVRHTPAHNVSHTPTHNVSHPPAHNVSHPPAHNVSHPPAHNVRHTPTHNVRHPPTHNVSHPAAHNVRHPPTHNVSHPPTHNVRHPPTHNVSHPAAHNVRHPPTHKVSHPPAHNVSHPPTHNVRHTPTHNIVSRTHTFHFGPFLATHYRS